MISWFKKNCSFFVLKFDFIKSFQTFTNSAVEPAARDDPPPEPLPPAAPPAVLVTTASDNVLQLLLRSLFMRSSGQNLRKFGK